MTIMSNGLEIGLRNWVGVAMTIFVRERKWHSRYVLRVSMITQSYLRMVQQPRHARERWVDEIFSCQSFLSTHDCLIVVSQKVELNPLKSNVLSRLDVIMLYILFVTSMNC